MNKIFSTIIDDFLSSRNRSTNIEKGNLRKAILFTIFSVVLIIFLNSIFGFYITPTRKKEIVIENTTSRLQNFFDEDYSEFGVRIIRVKLILTGINTYTGKVILICDGEVYEAEITVNSDIDELMWAIPRSELKFLN